MPHPGDNKYMATALLALRKKLTRQDVMAEVPGDHCFFVRYSGTVVVTNFTGLCTWPGSVCVAQVTGIAGCRNGHNTPASWYTITRKHTLNRQP